MSGSLGGYFNLGGDGGQGLGLNLSRFGRQVAEGVNKIVDNLVTEGQYYQGQSRNQIYRGQKKDQSGHKDDKTGHKNA